MSKPEKKGLVPMLRFPEFRDAGEWVRKPLCEIGEILQGYGFPEAFQGKTQGEYPFYKVSDISNAILNGSHFIDKAVNYIDKDDLALIRAKTIPAGTTVFAKIGEAIRSNRRAITTSECLIDNNVAGVKAIHGKANDLYIFYVLSQINLIEYSGGAVPSVNKTTLENIPVFSTQPEEQRKIADCLTSVGELITAQTQKLYALKTHKKGLMQQLFPVEGETVPKRRFPEFRNKGEWKANTFGGAATFLNGRAYRQDELLDNGKYRVLRVGNFFSNNQWYYSDLELEEDKYCDEGDLLYAWSASFGPRIWQGEKVIYHYHIWKVLEKRGVDRNFLFNLLEYETERMKSQSANGLGLMHITKGAIENWKCRIPEIEEQQKIADFLSSIDELITAQTQKLKTLKAHKNGLMQQLFPAMNEVNA